MSLEYRIYVPGDFEYICLWFHTHYEAVMWAGTRIQYPFSSTTADQLASVAPDQISTTLLLDGEPVGIYTVSVDRINEVARLSRIGVAPGMRRQGVGTHLLHHAIDHAFDGMGAFRLELNVFDENNEAQSLYRKLGFQSEGTRRAARKFEGYRLDLTVMSLLASERPRGAT